ncbi:MAG: efflux RND transporter periplasmic adaptor subunit, partial [Persephonella sp.]
MKKLILLLIFGVFYIAFGEEENVVSKNNIVPVEIQKELGIETEKVKTTTVKITKKYPALVKDDLTLSQKVFSPVEGIVRKLAVKEGDKVRKG